MRFRRYGLSQADYDRLLLQQKGVCAICGGSNILLKKNGNHVKNLSVDHDGKKVRGLLCGPCNRGIGYLHHDPILLGKAARYLVGWKR